MFFANLNSKDEAVEFITELRGYMFEKLTILEERESKWRECDPRYPDELPDEEFYPLLRLEKDPRRYRVVRLRHKENPVS